MKKIIVDQAYQLPEFPSVPYTPTNFWNTMGLLSDVKIIGGNIPERPTRLNDY